MWSNNTWLLRVSRFLFRKHSYRISLPTIFQRIILSVPRRICSNHCFITIKTWLERTLLTTSPRHIMSTLGMDSNSGYFATKMQGSPTRCGSLSQDKTLTVATQYNWHLLIRFRSVWANRNTIMEILSLISSNHTSISPFFTIIVNLTSGITSYWPV